MRVIAGTAKGRTLVAPKGLATRPTTDKVREAIFSMLMAEGMRRAEHNEAESAFPFPRVLDLYAGSGALGIEALSRGAEWVDFVDSSARARAAIQENLRRTGFVDRAAVHALRAEAAASTFRVPYDLILADPPYDDPSVLATLETIGSTTILERGGILVLEHARARALAPEAGNLHLMRSRYYGTTAVSLFGLSGNRPS
jgi:16S rRNA (guanine966-N2)-methyltransferase